MHKDEQATHAVAAQALAASLIREVFLHIISYLLAWCTYLPFYLRYVEFRSPNQPNVYMYSYAYVFLALVKSRLLSWKRQLRGDLVTECG